MLIFDHMFTFLQTISHTHMSHIMTRVSNDSYSTGDSHFPVTRLTTHFFVMTLSDSHYDSCC